MDWRFIALFMIIAGLVSYIAADKLLRWIRDNDIEIKIRSEK